MNVACKRHGYTVGLVLNPSRDVPIETVYKITANRMAVPGFTKSTFSYFDIFSPDLCKLDRN